MSITLEEYESESWFKIPNHDSLRPFFMSIVSDSNHWMFISSNGGISAGRKNPQFALFPYYTDDKLIDLAHTTGSKSIVRVEKKGETVVWEPFSKRDAGRFDTTRNLYKSRYGNKIMFEEVNNDLNLVFKYQWNSSNLYGFVKNSMLVNLSEEKRSITVLDGIQNIMPYGVSSDLQTKSSNLVDAYKRHELVEESGVGIFALSAIIVDKAEPSEALKANIAWSMGLENPTHLLSSLQLDNFRNLEPIEPETDVKGEKGAYFVTKEIELKGNSETGWSIVANVNQTQADVVALNKAIVENHDLEGEIQSDIDRGTQKLIQLVAASDGLQLSSDEFRDARHYSNTLFNIMRGGIFDNNYTIEKRDFVNYMKNASHEVSERNSDLFNQLSETFDKSTLDKHLENSDDPDLIRLGTEYLPLKFSRRHGDPSRPWNQFSINTHSEIDGSKILDYEGNWRDIFQNWEALAHSYPEFIEGMIFKFLNASTFDGYNPYRVTKGGFDWETIEPDDPWSYIGYWGDHQIIYLLKFLEFYSDYKPEEFKSLFSRQAFVYANVPYRIKSYDEIVENPKDTIEFDDELDRHIRTEIGKKGADGALLGSSSEEIHHVNFMEKILATVLAKVSNFVPEAGIWMNTQRPEWNDANNALVGNGVSMVTLYYLRRFLKFFEPLLADSDLEKIKVSVELAEFFESISDALNEHSGELKASIDNSTRKAITDSLGKAGGHYRDRVYENGFSGKKSEIDVSEIKDFVKVALTYLEHSIDTNKREDGLYHAYNLISFEDSGVSISYLDEMLEGQVAVLSSDYLNAEESLKVMDALRNSALYREDQQSYILYPNKQLPGFLEKNNIPEELVEKSELLKKLISDGNLRIINKDVEGGYHFNGNFKNAGDLKAALNDMKSSKYGALAVQEEDLVLDIFEEVFNHKAFTGRSGTFFAYEGLGSIYWHMVSKLHLAVLETCVNAAKDDADPAVMKRLATHFDEVGKGIGIHKDPEVYGAFPTDPYSHTPKHRGAQQPGMTGQVKEDILVRFGELGMYMKKGELHFEPFLLKHNQFTNEQQTFELVALDHTPYSLTVPANALAFTCCQVPVTYKQMNSNGLTVQFKNGSTKSFDEPKLDMATSAHIFQRTGEINEVTVSINKKELR
ncbi:hypothetical protein [Rhodohalobacter sp. 8-1]|uniref:hypothetical protein n=1 Tax=Rhodohalobacter sp. 8-1 TaxID=3131972 RepID=UPI0030EC865A